MLGGIFALCSAITFGLNNASLRRGVLTGSVLQALAITIPIGVPVFLVVAIFFGDLSLIATIPNNSVGWFAAAGVLDFVFGRYCNYRSTMAIGGNLSGAWRQSNLILALIMAVFFLEEIFTPLKILGIALIFCGALVMSKEKFKAIPDTKQDNLPAKKDKQPSLVFKPKYTEGYIFALLSALAYGSSPILIKFGLEGLVSVNGIIGGLISYSAAAVVILIFIIISGQWQHIKQMNKTSIKWFSLTAILVGFSQLFRYLALAIAPVSIVAPIQSSSGVFRVLFGWLINRNHEVIGPWAILGTILSMTGVIALTLSLELISEILA